MFKKLKALLGAEGTLEARARIVKALQAEEKRLGELIIVRVSAERELVSAETAVTLGEQADASAAQRKLDDALAAIKRQGSKLAGLRARLASQAVELEAQGVALKSGMPSHVEAIKASFSSEWSQGAAVFGAIMGRRAAIEELIGKLNLPELRPVTCELPADMTAPWRTMDGINDALEVIAGWSRAAILPQVDAMLPGAHVAYDPTAVYVITNAAAGAEVDSLVQDCSFVPGTLAHFAEIGYAVPLASVDWQRSLEAGSAAARRVSAEQERTREEQRQAQDVNRVGSYDLDLASQASASNLRVTDQGQYGRPIPAPAGKEQPKSQPRRVIGGF
jgi:hypothetical protein